MRLLEYKAKELLAKNSVPVPRGLVASTSTQAREAAERL
ncbi:MAG TPA: succinate--CoA ligase subunit beta, partial [Candidatus Bathyarchaeota archaeon]|nr:succinate--CoA ligase subunit beta [Candidatus Bathyarchaeota archaeon]